MISSFPAKTFLAAIRTPIAFSYFQLLEDERFLLDDAARFFDEFRHDIAKPTSGHEIRFCTRITGSRYGPTSYELLITMRLMRDGKFILPTLRPVMGAITPQYALEARYGDR